MFAQALQKMVGSRFCVDIDPTGRSAASYTWYEFVTPGIQMIPGEVWKWRKEASPDTIQMYISEELATATNKISIYLDECKSKADSDELLKYYKILETNFNRTKLKLYDDGFKAAIIRQCSPLFRRRGFSDKLDTVSFLFGTANGVLHLDRTCTLIDHFHEYPVSIFSPVAYHKFDPGAPGPWHQIVLDAVADIIAEPDARDWILFHAAQSLSGCPKEGLMLLWEGGGQNGKTSFLRWVAKALGPRADKFNIQLMCSEREDADKPNSAMMRFKHLTYAYSEESNKSTVMNVARMKEMVNPGEVSGRDLNSRQETFTMKANLVAASQYSFIINTTDHGTWRRLCHYTSKRKFRRDPDPNNEFEKKDDHRFVREYPDNPEFQSAFLSILVHYYERLQNEYNGELKSVNSPTISSESENFRRGQDTLHRWLSQFVMMSPSRGEEIPVAGLSAKYIEWYSMHIQKTKNNATALSACEIIKEIESSAISKHLRPASNGVMMLRGCRILPPDDNTLYPDETSLVAADLPRPDDPTCRDDGLNWWEARSIKPSAKPIVVNLEDEYKQPTPVYASHTYKSAEGASTKMAAVADDLLDAYFDSLEVDNTMNGIYADEQSLLLAIQVTAPSVLE
jgi:phage/plasmid-associated DNA primase